MEGFILHQKLNILFSVDAIVEKSNFTETAAELIEETKRKLLDEIKQSVVSQQVKWDDYLARTQKKEEDLLKEMEPVAKKRIKFDALVAEVTDGQKLKMMNKDYLSDLLIKFVRMSDKKDQQKVIDEIRNVLLKIGEEGF